MGGVRKAIIVTILIVVAGLTALFGLPFIAPIINAVARRKAPESGQTYHAETTGARLDDAGFATS
jgi:hypothetical protein